jgi:ERF superfamily
MITSASTKEIATALSKAQGEFKPAPFDCENPHFRNKYASLTSIMDTVRPVLAKHGLAITQVVGQDEAGMCLETRLMHISGEWISGSLHLLIDKQNMQGMGSAITYAKRYAISAILGVVSDEDDDAEAGSATSKTAPVLGHPSASPAISDADWVIPFGKKYMGVKLADVPIDQLKGFISWLQSDADREKKPLGAQALELIERGTRYIALKGAGF